ncbi:hypothetical protein [Haladaptatus halobius]|uniref:hypothetical protein n=1 Tax=Haladaptatus halobius TaxID=2884875 RepID=UPI001D09ECE0|nr:hypothetical protein [Haladaptatus halobius]
MNRREYLRLSGLALATSLAGCGRKPKKSKKELLDPYRNRFDKIVDMGNKDVDQTGSEPINSVITESLENQTLLYFPSGTYRLSRLDLSNMTNCGLVGNQATFLTPAKEQGNWIFGGSVQDLLIDGFTFDYTEPTAAPVIVFSVRGQRNILRNLTFKGSRGSYPRSGLELKVPQSSASLLVDQLKMRGGSKNGSAIYTHPGEGRLRFVNCHIENWFEGLYASPHSGPLIINGGTYANNGIDQVRIGGGESGARVENATIRVSKPENKPNMRGIWLEEGTNAIIDNCSVEITDLTGTNSSGGIVIGKQFGNAKITNTTIQTNHSIPGIHVRKPITEYDSTTMPSMPQLPSNHQVTCENIEIYGTAPGGTAIMLTDRDRCRFKSISIQHHFGKRHGITLKNVQKSNIHDCQLRVSGTPIVSLDSTPSTKNIETGGIGSLTYLSDSLRDMF